MKWDSPNQVWDSPNATWDSADTPSTNTGDIIMATTPAVRMDQRTLQADIASYQAMQTITGYTPANAAYSTANGTTKYTAMNAKQASETQTKAAADAARDDATSAEWDFHNFILGMKDQVRAQFGADSNELQAVGLKKKSERSKPSVKKSPAPTGP
jgi:hypothetical protein